MSIYAGTKWYLDAIEVRDVQRFEKSLLGAIKDKAPAILDNIRTEKVVSGDTEGKLKSFLDDFAKAFS